MTAGIALGANPKVGGAGLFETKTIVDNALNSKGPFAVLAPTIGDADQSNGVIHVVDTVLVPK